MLHDDRRVLDTTAILRYVVEKLEEEDIGRIAAAGQEAVSIGLAKLAIEAAKDCGMDYVEVSVSRFLAPEKDEERFLENLGRKLLRAPESGLLRYRFRWHVIDFHSYFAF